MSLNQLRTAFLKYNINATIQENKEVLDMYSNFLIMAIKNHHNDKVNVDANMQAKLIIQMMLTKALHLRGLINGVSFSAYDGTTLNEIIDPTVIAVFTRNIFETVGMFNLIYRSCENEDERTITYLLWVIAGLSYRQRFERNIISDEIKKKHEFEKQEIQRLTTLIEQNNLFQNLDERNQEKIKTRIKEKEYLIRFSNNRVVFLAWHDLINVMGIKPGLFDNIYTYFSLYSHPSNVSVFQFGELFEDEGKPFLELANFNLKYAITLFSIFIADYINLFPNVKQSFEQLPLLQQIVLNFSNKFARGEEYSINDSWKALN